MNVQSKKQKNICYYESQSSFSTSCGIHCINNFFGEKVCSKKQMDRICNNLSPNFFNPHKSVFGGDYDANVMMQYLLQWELYCQWFDSRNAFKIQEEGIKTENFKGFIINKKIQKRFYHFILGLSSRHWVAIRFIDEKFVYLDSLENGVSVFSSQMIQNFIGQQIKKQSFVIKVYKGQPQKNSTINFIKKTSELSKMRISEVRQEKKSENSLEQSQKKEENFNQIKPKQQQISYNQNLFHSLTISNTSIIQLHSKVQQTVQPPNELSKIYQQQQLINGQNTQE